MVDNAIVITTIHDLSTGVERFCSFPEWNVILVGDEKTPDINDNRDGLTFLSLEDQLDQSVNLADALPRNHYARKNLGYLEAVKQGYDRIADTDDDNIPYDDWDLWLSDRTELQVITGHIFPNIYELFTDEFVWPRGYPLSEIRQAEPPVLDDELIPTSDVGVVQGLADEEPDVDAIYRLILGDDVTFDDHAPIALDKGVYSPFNSQNTLWKEGAFVYMYLPAHVEFRFTDILRGYVAQRGLWAMDQRLCFTDASVRQDRNPHDLMTDFASEIPCYTGIKDLVEILDDLELTGNPTEDLAHIYRRLESADIVPEEELPLVDAWLADLEAAGL